MAADVASKSASDQSAGDGAPHEFPIPETLEGARGRVVFNVFGCQRVEPPVEVEGVDVTDAEFDWMLERRSLEVTEESLSLDYGAEGAAAMLGAFKVAGMSKYIGALNWPGVGTRWRQYLDYIKKAHGSLTDVNSAFRGFGRTLGRVRTYRALALDDASFKSIMSKNMIFPSGQLRVSAEELAGVVESKGVRCIAVARLYIAHLERLLGNDPSISLHDDWQTTTLIASGYARYDRRDRSRSKRVHLFEVSCPVVESMGWTLNEVAQQAPAVLGGENVSDEPWFNFPAPALPQGVWFDGRLQRTERYSLYGVPFLRERLSRIVVFQSQEQTMEALLPFAQHQAEEHARDTAVADVQQQGGKSAAATDTENEETEV